MTDFKWTRTREKAALALAQGCTQNEAASESKVSERTISRWLNNNEFSAEVDRLTHMVSIATRSERLRIAMRVARQKITKSGIVVTDKDLLDWLKFAQGETDGVKLDLTALLEAATQVADGGSKGTDTEE